MPRGIPGSGKAKKRAKGRTKAKARTSKTKRGAKKSATRARRPKAA